VRLSCADDLRGCVHREGAGPLEPELVSRSREQGKERIAVARGAVAETRPLDERTGPPGQLASCP